MIISKNQADTELAMVSYCPPAKHGELKADQWMQDILKKTIVKGENEWDGKVVTGDIVGATWNHYWPKGFDWASELIQKNESRKNQGCAVKVKMGSHNGKIFSRTNRIPMVIYYPMVEYINYDGSREVKRLNVNVEV